MSQFFKGVTAGDLPATALTSLKTDSGTAIPVANKLILKGDSWIQNDDDGITVVNEGMGSENVFVRLTNRIVAGASTTDATPSVILSVDLGEDPKVFTVEGSITAFNSTDESGASYSYVGSVRTDGASATEIGIENKSIFEEASMSGADISLGVSGNNAILTVTGIGGKNITWDALFTYRSAG